MTQKASSLILLLVLTACQWPVADQFNNPEDRKAPSSVTYTLTMTNGLGGVITPSGSFIVNKGKATSILAQANDGYSFVNWTVPTGTDVAFGNANASATTVALNLGNATVKANFGPITITNVAGFTLNDRYGEHPFGYNGENILATTALLESPFATATDSSGNLYIADYGNHRIRKVLASTKVITTVVGTGVDGSSGDGGLATEAVISRPYDLAMDTSGNVYFTDNQSFVIRKVSAATGIISSVAGTGTSGFNGDGDLATSATIGGCSGLAFDSEGNLVFGDNYRIRKIAAATGIISTIVGNGSINYGGDGLRATATGIGNVTGLTIDRLDNLYFVDQRGSCIRKVPLNTGIITTVAGNGGPRYDGDGGLATATGIGLINDVAVDSVGNLYISCSGRILKVKASTGIITTIAGNGIGTLAGDGGPALYSQVSDCRGLALDQSGNLYLSDTGNHRIRKIPGAGAGVGP